MSSQTKLRESLTSQIVAALDTGGLPPWRRPWKAGPNSGTPINIVSKKPYRGINPILLEMASARPGFSSKWWGTFQQWKLMGGMVKRRPAHVAEGMWGTGIVFWSPITKAVTTDEGEEEEDRYWLMRSYTVFCVDQVEGVHLDHLRADPDQGDSSTIDYQPAEIAIAATGADIKYGGSKAYYDRAADHIRCPPRSSFSQPNEFYATLLHELVHWTEHSTRLNWSRKEAGNSYALGELVAEIGSCYLARELGVPASDDLGNHVSYMASWLKAMKNDPRFIFMASSQASKAADYVLSFSRATAAEPEPVMA